MNTLGTLNVAFAVEDSGTAVEGGTLTKTNDPSCSQSMRSALLQRSLVLPSRSFPCESSIKDVMLNDAYGGRGAKRSTIKAFGCVCAVLFALAICFGVQATIADEAQAQNLINTR
mgnify:CR=1 FL=1